MAFNFKLPAIWGWEQIRFKVKCPKQKKKLLLKFSNLGCMTVVAGPFIVTRYLLIPPSRLAMDVLLAVRMRPVDGSRKKFCSVRTWRKKQRHAWEENENCLFYTMLQCIYPYIYIYIHLYIYIFLVPAEEGWDHRMLFHLFRELPSPTKTLTGMLGQRYGTSLRNLPRYMFVNPMSTSWLARKNLFAYFFSSRNTQPSVNFP